MNEQERIKFLSEKIDYYNNLYYQKSISEISDFEFDKLLEELVSLEKKFPQYRLPDSPTQRVGGSINKNFNTIKHRYAMLSLGNTYSEQDLEDFDQRVKKILADNDIKEDELEYFCELKFDGLSISLRYENGLLTQGVTRGDGTQGDEVTDNVKTIKTLPIRLKPNDFPADFEVRGEVFMSNAVFKKINEEREAQGLDPHANPRNTASGALKLQDSAEVARRKLDLFLYFLYGENLPFATHEDCIKALEKWGFQVSQTYKKCKNLKEVLDYINYWDKERKNLPLETDGVVIKVNNLAHQKVLGFTAKSPRWAIAYKYKSESVTTLLKSVTFQVGRLGTITPVAELEPVQLTGSTIRRASLHNANEMERLGLHIGDTLFIEKGGEIIPKVTGVDTSKRKNGSVPFAFITHCPECYTQLVKNEGEAQHFCPNVQGCPPQIKGKLEHFIGRKAMNIDSLGEGKIELLFDKGLIRNIEDFYDLTPKALLGLEKIIIDPETGKQKKISLQQKTVQNLMEGLEKTKEVPFMRVLYAIGIRYVGEGGAKRLAEHFENIENIKNATLDQLTQVNDVGETTAKSVFEFFQNAENIAMIDRLKQAGLQFEHISAPKISLGTQLTGKNLLYTGTFSVSREIMEQKILHYGGKLSSGVSKNLDYLIVGDGAGASKLDKAKKANVKMISEQEFFDMIGENPANVVVITPQTIQKDDKKNDNNVQPSLF